MYVQILYACFKTPDQIADLCLYYARMMLQAIFNLDDHNGTNDTDTASTTSVSFPDETFNVTSISRIHDGNNLLQ